MNMRQFNCEDCKIEVITKSAVKRFCDNCSAKRHINTKIKSSTNPDMIGSRQKYLDHHSDVVLRGQKISNKSRSHIDWYSEHLPSLDFVIRFSIPFDQNFTKNNMWRSNFKTGHVYMRNEARTSLDNLIITTKNAIKDYKFRNGKVWIDLLIQKPHMRGDAINFIDSICDAIKIAIGIDDRWFSLRMVDWEVIKINPQIFIGIGQEGKMDEKVCSYCGRILKLEMFRKNKKMEFGVTRECKDCLRKVSQLNKLNAL